MHWNKAMQVFDAGCELALQAELLYWLEKQELVGFNFTYDKHWIESRFNIKTTWKACARIMWHLADAPATKRPYGLKNLQTELLGWESNNERELKENVTSYGGSITDGQHYLADLDVLAKYACLDAFSTIRGYSLLSPFFDKHEYWAFLSARMAYNELLDLNSRLGIKVDVQALQKANKRLIERREAAKKRFLRLLKPEVTELEENWKDYKVSQYKMASSKALYLQSPHRWKRLNLNSDSDKRELFYGKLGLPILETTDSGLPSTSADALRHAVRTALGSEKNPALEAYLKYEKANTLSTNFTGPYLDALVDNRLHPGFNICGTVSYRLGGFKPYLLNAPYDEKDIMRCLRVEEGHIGVHADLSAIEPTIAAHYSDDPTLLKVFRDGLGDIYLDLALALFPNDEEFQNGYNTNAPVTEEIKKRWAKQRKIAKVIQLAVSYTGTGHTVSKNLTKDGVPTSVDDANGFVARYWQKFSAVAAFQKQLQAENRKEGYVRDVTGKIIRVPYPDYKDLYNRFLQSSGHSVLELWVMEIYRLCGERGIAIRPVVLDIHDSTSNACPLAQVNMLKKAYSDALQNVNAMLQLTVQVKADIKTFTTLAGLKQEE
jgi:DNA polymerase I-like protein with 3'-5' exonuclease and polymerase domains